MEVLVVGLVQSQRDFDNLKITLGGYLGKLNILILTNNQKLYPQLRAFLDSSTLFENGERLVRFIDKPNLGFRESFRIIHSRPRFVVLLDNEFALEEGDLGELVTCIHLLNYAGLVGVDERTASLVNDVYATGDDLHFLPLTSTETVGETDLIFEGAIVTRYALFEQHWVDCEDALEQYSLKLRQLGYRNFVDKRIKIKYGKNNIS